MEDRWFRLGDRGRYHAQSKEAMRFSLRALLLVVPVVICCLCLWDIVEVTKADGGRDITVTLQGLDNEQIKSVKYATVRSRDLDDIFTNFPNVETEFHKVTKELVTVRVSWSSTTSATGRLLDYGETPDTILFLIKYRGEKPKFGTLAIPHYKDGSHLQLSL